MESEPKTTYLSVKPCLVPDNLHVLSDLSGKHPVFPDESIGNRKLPVEKRIFCDAVHLDKEHPTCGINALSHYTMLNPDDEIMIMMTGKEYREAVKADELDNMNPYDGNVIIEVWKYPAVRNIEAPEPYVDRLSLALSLKEDKDPRVEKEVERLIDEIEWKD